MIPGRYSIPENRVCRHQRRDFRVPVLPEFFHRKNTSHMFTKGIIIFFLLLTVSCELRAQSLWMVGDVPCNAYNYFQELWKELAESKYGEHLRYARNVGEMKEARVGDFVIVFTCALDTLQRNCEMVSVGRSFTRISQLADGGLGLNMLQSSTTLVTKEKFLETLRQNRSDILGLLALYYPAAQQKPAEIPGFPAPGNKAP